MVESIAIGLGLAVVPAAIALLLPRKKTIGYGSLVYKVVGKFLAQQGAKISDNSKKVAGAIAAIRCTLVDFAFGIYIASIGGTADEKQAKIDKYLEG